MLPKGLQFSTRLKIWRIHFKVESVQKKQRFLKDKIMDDKMIKNYFVINHFVFWGSGLSGLGTGKI
jgi:hypothetical protein